MTTQAKTAPRSTPEWQINLNATPVHQRCLSQTKLLRSIDIMRNMLQECGKGKFLPTQPKRFLLLCAGLVEMHTLQVCEQNMIQAYQGKMKLLEATMAENHFAEITMIATYSNPTIAFTPENLPYIAAALTSRLSWQITEALDVLGVAFNFSVHDAAYLHRVRKLKLLFEASPWSKQQRNFAQLKTHNADHLLKEVGSELTVDIMQDYVKVFVPTEAVCDYLLAKTDQERVLKRDAMMDAVIKWLKEYKAAPKDYHQPYLRRLITTACTPNFNEGTDDLRRKSPLAVSMGQKMVQCASLANAIFTAEYQAAKASKHRDPAMIAYFASSVANHTIPLAGADYQKSKALIAEAKAALTEAKAWLPPAYYQWTKFVMNFAADQTKSVHNTNFSNISVDDVLNQQNSNPGWGCKFGSAPSLDAHCSVCGISGNDKVLQRCAGCKKVYYCSKECQAKDWKKHKAVCKKA